MTDPTIVWMITTTRNQFLYYLADYSDSDNTALWTKYKADAMLFESLEEITKFTNVFFYDRKGIHFLEAFSSLT